MTEAPPILPITAKAREKRPSRLRWDALMLVLGILASFGFAWCARHGEFYRGQLAVDGTLPWHKHCVVLIGSFLGWMYGSLALGATIVFRLGICATGPLWKTFLRLVVGLCLLVLPTWLLSRDSPTSRFYSVGLCQSAWQKVSPDELQAWAVNALGRFDRHELKTVEQPEKLYFSPSRVEVAPELIPAPVLSLNAPSVCVVTNSTGVAECISLAWYEVGIYVGSTNWQLRRESDWRLKLIRPGVYVYYHCNK